jgi:hypothetical protein
MASIAQDFCGLGNAVFEPADLLKRPSQLEFFGATAR